MAATRAARWARALLGLAVLAPLTVFAAVAGLKLGLWDYAFGYSTLTMRVGLAFAAVGAAAALGGGIIALGERRVWPLALVALVVAGVTAGVYGQHLARVGWPGSAPAVVVEATTNPADPPAFAGAIAVRRAGAGSGGVFMRCDGASVPTQVAPGAAAFALEEAGFVVEGFGVGRADGTRRGFWFGFTHDAVIRIRPGQTDVRVASREVRPDDGETCQLLQRIVGTLQAGA